jgi:hypothetical protein
MPVKGFLVAASPRRRLKAAIGAVAAICALAGAERAAAATPGKSYFFASRQACAVSGAFRKRDCDAAFANAEAELRDLAPTFSSRAECRLRFLYCETRRIRAEGDETGSIVYSPLALGVEMVAAGSAVAAAPVLAVETPASLFPRYPTSRAYAARARESAVNGTLAYNAILPADRFAPFPKDSASGALARFVPTAQAVEEEVPLDIASHEETAQERRARLKNAPFVE